MNGHRRRAHEVEVIQIYHPTGASPPRATTTKGLEYQFIDETGEGKERKHDPLQRIFRN